GATWTEISQGVRQACPDDIFTSAPGGSDSNRTVSVGGDELKKLRFGMEAEHAATVNPHATTAMTRLMLGSHHLATRAPPTPLTTIRACRDPHPKIPRPMGASLEVR